MLETLTPPSAPTATERKPSGYSALIGPSTQKLALRSNELARRFEAWINVDPKKRTNKAIARMVGYSESTISRYRGNTYLGDIALVESAIAELLVNDAIRADVRQTVKPFETEATRQLARHLEIIRAKPQIGMVVGEAGYGKTCGIKLYRESHPDTTLVMTASPIYGGGAGAIVAALWKQVNTRGYAHHLSSRGAFLVENVLRDSNRLIVVDEAHALGEPGRIAIRSLHDLTGCPIALVGNPRIREQWMGDDQNGSRVGFVGEVRLVMKGKKRGEESTRAGDEFRHLRPAVEMFMEQVWPEAAEVIGDLALEVAKHAGHLRALWLQCSLAMHLIDLDKSHGRELHELAKEHGITLYEQAFRTAHMQLVRGYELSA